MPFSPRKKPEPLDEAALYQYAVGALARQMRTVAELKRLLQQSYDLVMARLPKRTLAKLQKEKGTQARRTSALTA